MALWINEIEKWSHEYAWTKNATIALSSSVESSKQDVRDEMTSEY